MQSSRWSCLLFWVGLLPIIAAYPVPSSFVTDTHTSWQWEHYWMRYAIALSSVTATALTLAGCLCCQRHRRPKGFQEFKDGSSTGQDSAFERSVEGLELDASRTLAASERVQFEPLPVDSIVSGTKAKATPLSPPRNEEQDTDRSILQEPCSEWFESNELNVPREKLKYLREIGHGWFGKVVEGRADLEQSKSGGVVVRILTEEATTREKAWFLGEATPYLKLRHQNVLALLGFCLETDPYLLLFESCPAGDLKGFLLSNRDAKSREALNKENVPVRIAIEIAAGLKHMHNHGFAHTDLSARNCLVAPDLSAKLGDYGTGVEKYPDDYYIVGDRALPIRWSAPESLNCTDTTIETREITPQANMWSYAVLLWEIVSWGERPYDDMNDEQVIQMILSMKKEFPPNGVLRLTSSSSMHQATRSCLSVKANDRPSLDEVRRILLNEHADFEQRWESLRVRSASLQDLRGSIDSDYWTHIVDDGTDTLPFRLGPDEQVRNIPVMKNALFPESGSETEEESWKGRIEQGVYTEKVKQKSKSVTDLMVLVHIDPDSDAEWSLGAPEKKKLPGSDGELRHTAHVLDEFDEALKKLRDPLPPATVKSLENPKLLTLTVADRTPILRLSLDTPDNDARAEKHVLRLLQSKADPPLLRYVPDRGDEEVLLWNHALDSALERKIPGFSEAEFNEYVAPPELTPDVSHFSADGRKADDEEERKQLSTPDDEQSSDSGFRDKESCEEEEASGYLLPGNTAAAEEEPFQILFELDTILDAEYYAAPESMTISTPANDRTKEEEEEEEEENTTPEKDFKIRDYAQRSYDSETKVYTEQSSQGDYEKDEDEDSSTMSLRSDNSYVSFGIEEEFVTAIRNELREKLPQAQMQIVESLESHDDPASDAYGKRWDDEDGEDASDQISSGVDISIRYNVYGTPLSPIQEERESNVTSESLMSNSREASVASRESEDVLLVDTRTNEMILLEGLGERLQDEDTTNGDLSEEENLDYTCSMARPLEDKSRIVRASGGAPLPSPEEESKWQQLSSSFPLPLPLQDDLMSTSFVTEHECCSQDEDEEEENEEEEEEDEEEENEDNSSSSGEFVWKRYNEPHIEQIRIRSAANNDEASTATSVELEEDLNVEDEEEEEEFTPSAWNAALAPHRSALRSPDKTLKSGDQKKSVWFKKQRYHCVYEYPKETLSADSRTDTAVNSEATSYSDWEEMIDEPRLDLYPLDYDEVNHTGNEEFFVTSSNRPFQFQTGESKYVSQFFPGANMTSFPDDREETDGCRQQESSNHVDFTNEYEQQQQHQLGELRHTRDRLKLNLISSNGTPSASFVKQPRASDEQVNVVKENYDLTELIENVAAQDQHTVSNDNVLPKVPHEDVQLGPSSTRIFQCDSEETFEPADKYSVLAPD
ncbi:PREDICTED: uncharacterized protein LOC106744051 isoform X2 [Dinoponera quadriceps]|uniref:Uncharacterized protein LOC106744051 isoform X2 n=1 Tax=Dinoponera quadriceps TaxID=609295 RepID=A0A6P3X6C4_DINQU|nr:PREDICTED: uncharacterized protein LOC106744051 isoform X2 [Dinoponera quadriceps]